MNQNLFNRTLHKGFTLVELLMVVVILSILAAIALPQFTGGADDARLAALDTTLGNMRAVIDLYSQQHNGVFPGELVSTGATCDTGAADATGGTARTLEAFMAQLTLYTNAAGQACTGPGPNFPFGPYLKKNVLADNPVTSSNDLAITFDGVLGMTGVADPYAVAPVAGWAYNTGSGQFIANDARLIDPDGPATGPTYDQL